MSSLKEKNGPVVTDPEALGVDLPKTSNEVVAETVAAIGKFPAYMREGYRFVVTGSGEGRRYHDNGSLAEVIPSLIRVEVVEDK